MKLMRDKFAGMSYLELDGEEVIPDFDKDGNLIGLELFGVPMVLDYLEPSIEVGDEEYEIQKALEELQSATIN